MTDTIVVLGKRTVRQSEIVHLQTFGQAMAMRGKTLVTTQNEGVASIVAAAYREAGGTPVFLTNDNYEAYTRDHPVVAFTDKSYLDQLDTKVPHWRDGNWLTIHNPKATQEAASFLTSLLAELGTPIPASA